MFLTSSAGEVPERSGRAAAAEGGQGQARSAPPSCREAAAEGSQGQARSAPPLDGVGKTFQRPERAPDDQRLANLFHAFGVVLLVSFTPAALGSVSGQTRVYPKEIRGYKVERAAVELKSTAEPKQPSDANRQANPNQETSSAGEIASSSSNQNTPPPTAPPAVDQLIKFGSPSLARITPLGITFNVPVVIAPIKQGGHVDFLLFEDMTVNGHSVDIDEYHRGFDLPTKKPLTLSNPLQFYIYLPVVALAAVDELRNSKETWPVTGRVYVCGKYKKFLLKFKRCVPVELQLSMRSPLKER